MASFAGKRRIASPVQIRLSLLLVLLFTAGFTPAVNAASGTNSAFLFSFFREPNGQAGLQLAWCRDGLKWAELKPPTGNSFLVPAVGGNLMRDPCLRQGPDGTFRLVWTTSWGRPTVFGYASSKDLVHWTQQRAVPVLQNEPAAANVWAPELFYDDSKGQWLIFWSTTIPGRFPETANAGDQNHRIYFTATKDFESFTLTKLLYDGGFNVIDATILAANGKYYLIVKDETKNPVKKNLRIAVGDRPEGPYGAAGPPIGGLNWVEGPSAIQIDSAFYIFFDHYSGRQYYGAVQSNDLNQWQDISSQVSFPRGARHGTVSRVSEALIHPLESLPDNQTKSK